MKRLDSLHFQATRQARSLPLHLTSFLLFFSLILTTAQSLDIIIVVSQDCNRAVAMLPRIVHGTPLLDAAVESSRLTAQGRDDHCTFSRTYGCSFPSSYGVLLLYFGAIRRLNRTEDGKEHVLPPVAFRGAGGSSNYIPDPRDLI